MSLAASLIYIITMVLSIHYDHLPEYFFRKRYSGLPPLGTRYKIKTETPLFIKHSLRRIISKNT